MCNRWAFPESARGLATIALVGIFDLASIGCGPSGSSLSVSADAAPSAAVVQFRRTPPSNTLSIAGEFLPYQEVELHAKVSGYIKNINVDIGDHVHKGQVLAVLEIPELTAQLQAADGGVPHSQEEISRAQNDNTRWLIQAGTSNENSIPIGKLSQVNVLRLRLPVPESLAASVHDGEPADIRVKATNEHFSGTITRSTDALDRSTRTMQVEVDVPNRDYRLTPGMYADVSLRVQNDPNALTLPLQAINQGAGKTTVLLVDSQNHVEEREIHTGIEGPDRIQILSGLSEGARVIIGNLGEYQSS